MTPGTASAGASVTILGSGFGQQATGNVWIGSAYAAVGSWSDTQIVATVADSAHSGVAKVIQGGIWSNTVKFTVPPRFTTGPSVMLTPNPISMVVGDSRSIEAVDGNNTPVTGLTWASSDPTIASLSTDDPPVITALAPGHVTITAGGSSSDLTVYDGALPVGTVKWSVPGDGSGVTQIVPAVPSSTGVADVFARQASGVVQAITTEGHVAWSANVGTDPSLRLVPDFQGGLITYTSQSLMRLDGLTGQPQGLYFSTTAPSGMQGSGLGSVVPHTDGTIFTTDGDTLVGINPVDGTLKFSIPMDHSTTDITNINGPWGVFCPSFAGTTTTHTHDDQLPFVGAIIVAGDGYAYVTYQYSTNTYTNVPCINFTRHQEQHLRLLRVNSNGDFSKIAVKDWTSDFRQTTDPANPWTSTVATQAGVIPALQVADLITNADQGVVVSWGTASDAYCAHSDINGQTGCIGKSDAFALTPVLGGNVGPEAVVNIPNQWSPIEPMLQSSDGTSYGIVNVTDAADPQLLHLQMLAFDQVGKVKWNVPDFIPAVATSGGGLIAQSGSATTRFDAAGNALSQTTAVPVLSWSGQWYGTEADDVTQTLPQFSVATDCTSFWPQIGANPSLNAAAVPQCPSLLQSADPLGAPAASFQALASSLGCPICNLQPPQCITTSGTQSTFVIIVGDPGLDGHNLGNILNLAAQTRANALQGQGHRVVACRASSIQDFTSALLNHGFIDGGVIYFGHGGPFDVRFGSPPIVLGQISVLAVGQEAPADTNISFLNVGQLASVRTGRCSNINDPNCHIMGPNAGFEINGCKAGLTISDEFAHAPTSIAQEISNQTKRGVIAFTVGVYFSTVDATKDKHVDGLDVVNGVAVPRQLPNALPIFPVPEGVPGHKPAMIPFIPHEVK